MTPKIPVLLCILFGTSVIFAANPEIPTDPNQLLLPSPFPIYTQGTVVVNHPSKGFVRKELPTNNEYNLVPGCYIACYTHQSKQAIYPVSKDIFVVGQIRVAGNYNNRVCIPFPYEGKDISAAAEFKALCAQKFPACGSNCWAGGDTGGWFGIPPANGKAAITPLTVPAKK